jgi:cephalosporin-C deacetylase-like acetyl esterase
MKPRLLTRFLALLTLLTLASASPLLAQTLTVTTNHADATYRQGETVTFTITLTPPADAIIPWTITKDGVDPTTSGKAKLTNGTATVTGKLDEPGFLLCRAGLTTADNKPLKAHAGAAIDPLKIKPSMPVPDGFDAYWAGEKAKLAKVPMNPRLTPQASPSKNVEVFDLQADSIGNPVSAYYARPVGAKPKSLPAILTVHGAGVSNSGLGSAAGWAADGFISMDMNAHGIPNGKPAEFYAALSNGDLKGYSTRGRESRDTIYFHDMFLRLVRAIDFLTAQPEWDGRTVIVKGSSQGGYQSIVAAGLDPRVTFFVPGVPAGCDHTGFKAGRINGWPKFIPTGQTAPPGVVEAVRYYDAVNFATRTKAAALFTVGFIDGTCPPSSVYAAFNAVQGRHDIFNDIPSGHTNSPAAVAAMRKAILDHVKAASRP